MGWEATENTPLYLVTAEGQDRTLISCNSTSSSCLLAGVLCGMQYTIIVSASSDKCSSLRSPPQKVVTGQSLGRTRPYGARSLAPVSLALFWI